MTKARAIGLGFGILLILAAFGIVLWQTSNMPATNTAFAQGAATATPSASPSSGSGATPAPQQQQAPSAIGDTFWTLLAGKLGVSADDLKTKAVQARKEMIDQAVKDGRVTQEQADAIKARIDANNVIAPIQLPRRAQQAPAPNQNPPQRGPLPWRGPRNNGPVFGNGLPGGILGFGGINGGLEQLDAVAKVLKLEPKALIEQLSQGKSLADIAKAQGVDEAAVKQAIIDFRTGQIDRLLGLGLISEVQANQLKARLTPENIDLSRGFRFQFRTVPGQKSSQVLPDGVFGEAFGVDPNLDVVISGQAFGIASDADVFVWSDEFGGPFQEFTIPFGDIQTQ